jgi:hypothetical protein
LIGIEARQGKAEQRNNNKGGEEAHACHLFQN